MKLHVKVLHKTTEEWSVYRNDNTIPKQFQLGHQWHDFVRHFPLRQNDNVAFMKVNGQDYLKLVINDNH